MRVIASVGIGDRESILCDMEKGVFTSSPLIPAGLISPPSTVITCVLATAGVRLRNSVVSSSSLNSYESGSGISIKYVYVGTEDGRVISIAVPPRGGPCR